MHDYQKAKARAAAEGKDILIQFTGSDWCHWCKVLDDEVFSQAAFKRYAKQHLVLLELDYPIKKQQPSPVKAQNEKLKKEFAVSGFPTLYLVDSQGRPFAKAGYRPGGVERALEMLQGAKERRVERDRHLVAAATADGLDRARQLHLALQSVGSELAHVHYRKQIEHIVALDANNEAGLKAIYAATARDRQHLEKLDDILKTRRSDPTGTIAKINRMIVAERQDLSTRTMQIALGERARIEMFILEDGVTGEATAIIAIALDPQSKVAERIQSKIDDYHKMRERNRKASSNK